MTFEKIYIRHSQARDVAQLYIETMTESIVECTNEVRALWQEIDQYKITNIRDPIDAA